ncbi:MAG: phage tail sheath C-terminal domain-containing protein [Bacteroidota bacterium]
MAGIYKTPGVYVEEIPKFPPSIAPVETAIPAFIGYTEKADNLAPGDLMNIPKRIGSIADFELYYGFGHKPVLTDVKLDLQGFFKEAAFEKRFLLYDSLRMFYANGGGDCYIVSVGNYAATPDKTHFLNTNTGIQAIEKFDEPTILLFPDAARLANSALYEIQAAALAQCEFLKDRVGLFDLKETDAKGDEFRSKSGINSLKYGMTYTPWLNTSFIKGYTYRDISKAGILQRLNTAPPPTYIAISLNSLTADASILLTLTNLEKTMVDVNTVKAAVPTLDKLKDNYNGKRNTYLGGKTVPNFISITDLLFDIARTIDAFVMGATPLTNPSLVNAVKLAIGSLKPIYNQLISYDLEAEAKISGAAYVSQYDVVAAPTAPEWGTIFTTPPAASAVMTGATDAALMDSVLDELDAVFAQINSIVVSAVVEAVNQHEKTLNDALYTSFPEYKAIINGINTAAATLPPSGTIAGIYSFVDRTRGVWKAPANVSITGGEPAVTFSITELERLNVDTIAGKSINAIRPFTGKGTLVYGARTLAGNDNEWRYVPVRRFFNFVEESVKKATEQFVFEPNDSNTWVKVQAMIENFLTTLWRQGALQGIKPEHAFYVAVGLGKTMTALDILEGRMVIEIGMAVVRPAEFIILKFSHKMPES